MVVMPKEVAIVRRILEGWRAGGTYLGIAAQLNAEDVPTKRGGRWYAATVRNIVRAASGLVPRSSEGILDAQLIGPNGRISSCRAASPRTARLSYPIRFRTPEECYAR